MKRERMLQVAVGLLGVFYLWPVYPLYTDLWHSKWLLEMNNECEPMFLSWFIALAPFLLLAARKPLVAPLSDYLRCVPMLGPCFGNGCPNCGSVEARRSPAVWGCGSLRRHWRNFAGTLTTKTRAGRSRSAVTAEISPL